MLKALLIVIALALALPAPAAVYRCREKKGVLILTDDPDNFPPGCKAEGPLPPAAGSRSATAPAPAPAPPPGGTDRRTLPPARDTRAPAPAPPRERAAEELPAGSAGIPPGLNQPSPGATSPGSGTTGTPAVRPGLSPQQSEDAIAGGPELTRWLEEARALNREYLEAQAGAPPLAGGRDPRREIESRIDAFLTRLDNSPLSTQERAVVENELPPPQP